MRQLIRTYEITGEHEITIQDVEFTENDIRLIVNETQGKVLAASVQKSNVVSVVDGVITLSSSTPSLVSTDTLTIEIDVDTIGMPSTEEGEPKTIFEAIGMIGTALQAITGDTVTHIVEKYTDPYAEEIDEMLGDVSIENEEE